MFTKGEWSRNRGAPPGGGGRNSRFLLQLLLLSGADVARRYVLDLCRADEGAASCSRVAVPPPPVAAVAPWLLLLWLFRGASADVDK